MCTFCSEWWKCGIWHRCIEGFVRLFYWEKPLPKHMDRAEDCHDEYNSQDWLTDRAAVAPAVVGIQQVDGNGVINGSRPQITEPTWAALVGIVTITATRWSAHVDDGVVHHLSSVTSHEVREVGGSVVPIGAIDCLPIADVQVGLLTGSCGVDREPVQGDTYQHFRSTLWWNCRGYQTLHRSHVIVVCSPIGRVTVTQVK